MLFKPDFPIGPGQVDPGSRQLDLFPGYLPVPPFQSPPHHRGQDGDQQTDGWQEPRAGSPVHRMIDSKWLPDGFELK
jgi:hypothetical protein